MRFALNRGRNVHPRASGKKPIPYARPASGHPRVAEADFESAGPDSPALDPPEPVMEIRIGSAMGIRVLRRNPPAIQWRRPRKQLQPA
ncbi:MAG: hypothetical protein IRZ06_11750 [Nevskia sp.]|nr:hypothetical protein [Nevskia sp.]